MYRPQRRTIVTTLLVGVLLSAAVWRRASGTGALVSGQSSAADQTPRLSSLGSAAYTVGERIQPLQGVEFATSSNTLVAFVGSNCQFCIDSAPLYRAVAEERDRRRGALQFVVASREPVERLQAFAARYHVRADRLISVVTDHVKIRMTPTLVLLDRSGIVQGVWTGEQPGARGEAILQRLRASGS